MKQRLGIAAALLGKPSLLILDEPTNGLDPAGIVEMRSLIRSLADEGMTLFVSSHLLSEIEHICDHVVMIRERAERVSGVGGQSCADCGRRSSFSDQRTRHSSASSLK